MNAVMEEAERESISVLSRHGHTDRLTFCFLHHGVHYDVDDPEDPEDS